MDIQSVRGSKLCLLILLASLFFIQTLQAGPSSEHFPKLSLKISGTAGLTSWGDINTMINTFNNNWFFEEIRKTNPINYEVRGNILPLDKGLFGLETELRIELSFRLSFGLATSFPNIDKKNDSFLAYIFYPGDEIWPYYYRYKPEVKASMPFKFTLYFSPDINLKTKIFLFAGAGIYKGKISNFWNFSEVNGTDPADSDWLARYWETEQKSAVGFHCGIELERPIWSRLSFMAELEFRSAEIKNFRAIEKYWVLEMEGKEVIYQKYEESSGWLYYCREDELFIGIRYANLHVWEVPPDYSINFYGDIRKAKLDLTGVSLKIGIKLNLF